jgi:hypothetical protein
MSERLEAVFSASVKTLSTFGLSVVLISCGTKSQVPSAQLASGPVGSLPKAGAKSCAELDAQTLDAPIRSTTVGLNLKKGETVSSIFYVVPKAEAYHCYTFMNEDKNFPPTLQGIWFMNGNELGDELVSLSNGKVTKELFTGRPRISLNVWGSRNFSYLGASDGIQVFSAARKFGLYYQVKFDSKGIGYIVPALNLLGNPQSNNEPWLALFIPKFLVNFSMEVNQQIKSDYETQPGADLSHVKGPFEWIRKSTALVNKDLGQYQFQRMIDGEGNVIPEIYQKYLAHRSEVKHVLVPR